MIPPTPDLVRSNCDLAYSSRVRDKYIREYGFTIVSYDLVNGVFRHSTNLLEVGAGSGALSRALSSKGANVIATDAYTGNYGLTVGEHYPTQRHTGAGAVRRWSTMADP